MEGVFQGPTRQAQGQGGRASPAFLHGLLLPPPGIAARDVAHALRALSQAARGVAANTAEPQVQAAMLECAGDVMDKACNLIEEARKAVARPGDPESQQRLAQVSPPGLRISNCSAPSPCSGGGAGEVLMGSAPPQVAKAVSQALSRCVNCLPGQRDVDAAIRTVGDASKRLLADSVSAECSPGRSRWRVPASGETLGGRGGRWDQKPQARGPLRA